MIDLIEFKEVDKIAAIFYELDVWLTLEYSLEKPFLYQVRRKLLMHHRQGSLKKVRQFNSNS